MGFKEIPYEWDSTAFFTTVINFLVSLMREFLGQLNDSQRFKKEPVGLLLLVSMNAIFCILN
jgi:hypothetical protein